MLTPQTFDEAWPELADRLRGSLIVRGVPAQDRDDVVQETALRVYRAWHTIDPERPAWPFVVTVALNIWRDMLRERSVRDADIRPVWAFELTGDHDVERAVLARQELAIVGAAMRSLAPEQRRLLLATEDFADTVRPLLPAERVARMRVRRQLARAVGRASALVAVVWLRRPARAAGLVATAYVGAMAAAVLTTPAPAFGPDQTTVPGHTRPPVVAAAAPVSRPMTPGMRIVARAVPAALVSTARTSVHHAATPRRHPRRTHFCSPQKPPSNLLDTTIHIGSAGIYDSDGRSKPTPIIETPPVDAQSGAGCVAVG